RARTTCLLPPRSSRPASGSPRGERLWRTDTWGPGRRATAATPGSTGPRTTRARRRDRPARARDGSGGLAGGRGGRLLVDQVAGDALDLVAQRGELPLVALPAGLQAAQLPAGALRLGEHVGPLVFPLRGPAGQLRAGGVQGALLLLL